MGWFNKKQENTSSKITTNMTSDQTRQKSELSHSDRTTKKQTAVAGGNPSFKRYRKKKALTETDYNAIHALHQQGMPNVQIAVVIGVSAGHVGTLLRFETWEDYCAYKAEITSERKIQMREQRAEARRIVEAQQAQEASKELEQWQFIVGWSSQEERLKANAVRDLAKALGLRVEE